MAKLEFITNPYITEQLADAKRLLEGGEPAYELYYLCAGKDSKFALEIIKGAELAKPLYDKKHYLVIGAACSRAEAFELVRRVVKEVVGGCNIDGFEGFNGIKEV